MPPAHDATTSSSEGNAPAVILVGAQLGENIGTAARAMLNCGLMDLRIVAPRDGWPSPRAYAAASGADVVIDNARLFDTPQAALADLNHVYATTRRPRDMVKPVLTPAAAATEIHEYAARGERSGLLFGPERIGLTNDEVTLADVVVTAPLNPAFSSLNLAQAVLLIAWEWRRAGDDTPPRRTHDAGHAKATHEQLFGFFDHLERALEANDYFKVEALRPTLIRNLRNLFQRADLTDQDVRTLHGVVTALCGRRRDQLP